MGEGSKWLWDPETPRVPENNSLFSKDSQYVHIAFCTRTTIE